MENKTGLFFGSFNPIHIGHLAIANYLIEFSDMNVLWFVITPQNPFKKRNSLLSDQLRLEMVELAIKGDDRFRVCDVEFRMPVPSFTIDTLMYLKEKHPRHNFQLIMGSDNLDQFHKWKNYDIIEKNFKRIIYPRPGSSEININELKNCEVINAPLMEISSSFIRKALKSGKKPDRFLPAPVYEFIEKMNLYR